MMNEKVVVMHGNSYLDNGQQKTFLQACGPDKCVRCPHISVATCSPQTVSRHFVIVIQKEKFFVMIVVQEYQFNVKLQTLYT